MIRYLSKLLIIILVISQLSACSFTAIGQRKVLALESEALAPYKDDIRGGWIGGVEYHFFETEQSIYHIIFNDQLTEWQWEILGIFFLLPLLYYGGGGDNFCTGEETFDFTITEITKQPNTLFQRFSIEDFSFYDHETQQSFKPINIKAKDEIRSDFDIYHLPSKKKYRGIDLFGNQQIYENIIEFSIDDMSCKMITPDDKLMIRKPPYIDVTFTFADHKKFFGIYMPHFFDNRLDIDGNPVNGTYSPEDVKHKVEPLSNVKNLEK
ncbi:MAG: hypothetical protein K0U45_06465 [Alphaproteobacteria bacterium]|nr:hypothetical protein [Alphaproteobacteria bacterium]